MKEKPFRKLRGQRVYLELPEMVTTNLVLSDATKLEMARKEIMKLNRLKVYAVGDSVEEIKEGDEVLVDKMPLANALVTDLGDVQVLVINSFDIQLIW